MINPKTTHLLIRHQEIALKGRNRPRFEWLLQKNLSRFIKNRGHIQTVGGRILVVLNTELQQSLQQNDQEVVTLVKQLSQLSGIRAISPCCLVENSIEAIETQAIEWAKHDLQQTNPISTFRVRVNRINKQFPLSSETMGTKLGSQIHSLNPQLKVNLKHSDLTIHVEIRKKNSLIYSWEQLGMSGLPLDPTQRVACLLSGGIDSPVAVYEVMRRGCYPILIHFHSKPFTSEASIQKVKRLASTLKKFSPYPLELWLVPLLPIQQAIHDQCSDRTRTVLYRRFMMRIAQEIAQKQNALALVTGEAIGQVASQTLTNLNCIENTINMPVLRPLITQDKDQIIHKAKEIATYAISIEPHDDTCTLFAPRNPTTQARLQVIREEEDSLPIYKLVFNALDQSEKIVIKD